MYSANFNGIPQGYIKNGMIADNEIESGKIVSLAGSKLTGNAPNDFVTNAGIVSMDGSKLTGTGFLQRAGIYSFEEEAGEYTSGGSTVYITVMTAKIHIPNTVTSMYFRARAKVTGGSNGCYKAKVGTASNVNEGFSATAYNWFNEIVIDVSGNTGWQDFLIQLKTLNGSYPTSIKGFSYRLV